MVRYWVYRYYSLCHSHVRRVAWVLICVERVMELCGNGFGCRERIFRGIINVHKIGIFLFNYKFVNGSMLLIFFSFQ